MVVTNLMSKGGGVGITNLMSKGWNEATDVCEYRRGVSQLNF